MVKKNLPWLILGIVLIALAVNYINGRDALKRLKAVEEMERVKIADLELRDARLTAANADLDKKNVGLEAAVARAQEEKRQLKAERDSARTEISALKAKIMDGPPEYVLAEHQRILATQEIWLIRTGAEFSLAAFRKNGAVVTEWEQWKLTLIPNLERDLSKTEGQVTDLQIEVSNFKLKDLNWQEKERGWGQEKTSFEVIIKSKNDYIALKKRESIFSTILKVGGGIALGWILGK
jgi:hypothetical protein